YPETLGDGRPVLHLDLDRVELELGLGSGVGQPLGEPMASQAHDLWPPSLLDIPVEVRDRPLGSVAGAVRVVTVRAAVFGTAEAELLRAGPPIEDPQHPDPPVRGRVTGRDPGHASRPVWRRVCAATGVLIPGRDDDRGLQPV